MEKIKLNQLAFYLSYQLRGYDEHFKTIEKLTPDNIDKIQNRKEFKPILKSISNISQNEIEELFEMFGDMVFMGNVAHFSEFLQDNYENLDCLPLRICEELAKRHYDIFDLIQNNLAIDSYSC